MKEPVKILYITQELDPYVGESEIAGICRQYAQFTQERGCEIRTFMPCYGHINERRNQLHEVQRLSGINVIIDDSDRLLIIKVASISAARMQVYFIDNEDYFHRRGVLKDSDTDKYFDDNDERAIFFVRSVLETIKKLRWTPDIIHCHGFLSALAPLYVKKTYNTDPFFSNSKVIYSIYGNDMDVAIKQGFDKRALFDGVDVEDVKILKGRTLKSDNMHKIAVNFSDAVICASDTISEELDRYIKKKKIPCLPYSEEGDYRERYFDFFKTVFPSLAKD